MKKTKSKTNSTIAKPFESAFKRCIISRQKLTIGKVFFTAFVCSMSLYSNALIDKSKLQETDLSINQQIVTFTENKGQVRDQNLNARPDVLYSGMARGMVYHLRNNGISYQLGRSSENKNEIYRLDIKWLNINQTINFKNDEALFGYENFYIGATPILNIKTYKGVTYKNIYNNIDLHYYEKNGDLKYDFIIAPNSDYKQIQFLIEGSEEIKLQSNGSIILKTAFGDILEGAPIVFQNGEKLEAKWIIKKNILSFEVENYNPLLPLLIDPATRVWGTYYGGTGGFGATLSSSLRADANGNVYLSGNTDSFGGTLIATTGAHQTTNGGQFDTYLVKFNNAGVRQWATYYGGTGFDSGSACSVDAGGNVYFSGQTDSQSNITTTGSHQQAFGGGQDAFLVKFNSAGVRQWATYYGGTGNEATGNNTVDNAGNIYLVGSSKSSNAISTAGSHQASYGGTSTDYDGFLVKFNTNGIRQWATYYGGSGEDVGNGVYTDLSGNVFISGSSISTSGISSAGSHQSSFGGGANDAFLAKFNNNGVRQWGTYYGDSGDDIGNRCSIDISGNVYLVGETSSTSGISTAGSHQNAFGGGTNDGFVAKFNTGGVRQWGSYYGGSNTDGVAACVNDASGNVLITGLTKSTSNIATVGSHQDIFGGGTSEDAFLVKFNSAGVIQWGTYYGGSGRESGEDVDVDMNGKVYMGGLTGTSGGTAIATTGSHQSNFIGGNNGFLVQFSDCNGPTAPVNTTAANNLTLCGTGTTTLNVSASANVNWFSSSTSTTTLGSGVVFATPVLGSGIHTFFAETTNTCSSSSRTGITVTVSPLIMVNSGTICAGNSFTMIPSGVISFTFANGNAVVNPLVTTSYTVNGTDQAGCIGSAISTITVNPLPIVTVNSGTLCSGNQYTIQPAGAASYSISGITAFVSPTVTSTYTITGMSIEGCTDTAICTITVNPSPSVTAVSNRTLFCKGNTAVLTASGAATYSWNTGSSSSSISISPTVTTSYTVIGTGTNTCAKSSVITQSVSACTDIESVSANAHGILIIPNPTNGLFRVATKGINENATLEIFNSIGQLILSDTLNSTETSINLTHYASGVYFIRLLEGNEVKCHSKIIKQ